LEILETNLLWLIRCLPQFAASFFKITFFVVFGREKQKKQHSFISSLIHHLKQDIFIDLDVELGGLMDLAVEEPIAHLLYLVIKI